MDADEVLKVQCVSGALQLCVVIVEPSDVATLVKLSAEGRQKRKRCRKDENWKKMYWTESEQLNDCSSSVVRVYELAGRKWLDVGSFFD